MKRYFTAALLALFLGHPSIASAVLVAHWGLDEASGATARDSVGGVDGTLVSGASFTATDGIKGGCIQITTGYVDMGDNFAGTPTFSVVAWVKTGPGDTDGMTIVSKHWSTISQGYFLSVNNVGDGWTQTDLAGFYTADRDMGFSSAVGGPAVNDGQWHQLVGVYDNGTTSLYVDGNLAGSGWSYGCSDNIAHFMVGGYFSPSGEPVNYFKGFIDEVGVYNHALSENEVKNLYNNTINPVSPCECDLNHDGRCDMRDWLLFGKSWGRTNCPK